MTLIRRFERFFRHDAFGGILLMASAVAAIVVANGSLAASYEALLDARLSITINDAGLSKPLILWINDGLMAVFFFLIGLELKREMLEGRLKNRADVVLPGLAALGGMVVPALIFAALNWGNPATIGGWAIPAATDIAFALGVLALLGNRVPPALKVFLLTLAILDDLGAILVIAVFYTAELQPQYLLMAVVPLTLMYWLNHRGTHRVAPFVLFGVLLWVLVLKSGVHATLAGVVTAFFVPLKDRFGKSPLHSVEHGLSPYVLYAIIPIFAFANAGVVLAGLSPADLANPVPLGVALGLVLGKQIGVLGTVALAVAFGFARLPESVTWQHIYGAACLAGIGFTMSLFIGSLSYSDPVLMNDVRLGVMVGSLVSGVLGYLVLRAAPVAQLSPQPN